MPFLPPNQQRQSTEDAPKMKPRNRKIFKSSLHITHAIKYTHFVKTVSLLDTGTAEQPAYMEQHPVSQESGGG